MAIKSRRAARIGLELDAGKLNPGISEARKKLRSFAQETKRTLGARALGALGRGTRGLLGAGRKVGGGLLMGAGFGAIGGIGDAVSGVVDFEKALTRFQIAGERTPAQMGAFRTELGRVSGATGIARDELLAGASAYVALTGDANGAVKATELFAKVSNATGASMADISASAAAMRDNLKIDPSEFEAAFSALHVQGKAGAVELRELATELAGVAPSFAQFKGGTGAAGLAKLGSALQVVRKGFGSTSEAATGLQGLMVAVVKNAKRFEAAGVKIFTKNPKTGKKELRDFVSIVDAISKSKLAKDPTLLGKAFGRDEARRAYDQIAANRDLLSDLITKSSDVNAINRDAATFQQSAAGKLARTIEALKTAVAEAFTPERIEAFVEALSQAAEVAGKIVNALGAVASWGKSARGALSGAPLGLDITDMVAAMGGDKRAAGRVAESRRFQSAAESIMAGEVNERTTSESLRRALAAKYADIGPGGANIRAGVYGEQSAGSAYLKNAGFVDPADAARQVAAGIGRAQALSAARAIVVQVKLDSDVVAEGHNKSKRHRTGPVGR